MPDPWPTIDANLVRSLIEHQCPEFAGLSITPVSPGGWDHRTFRLGEELVVRLPSAARYAAQIMREACAFGQLDARLPHPIPRRIWTGPPSSHFPAAWAINAWLAGWPPAPERAASSLRLAKSCADFLNRLGALPIAQAIAPDPGNFHRGGDLGGYAGEVERALGLLDNRALADRARSLWELARESTMTGAAQWVHGDFFPWNMLVREGDELCGVIDWGLVATGDPACDLAIAWTCFDPPTRNAFRQALDCDAATWNRGRGWALWKAITLTTGVNTGPPDDLARSHTVLDAICAHGG